MAREYGRYGYRHMTALLRAEGWWVNHKRAERILRQEGPKVPVKQPNWRRLRLGDGSCIRLRPTHWNQDVLERLSDLFVRRGLPDHIRSDNGSEFTAKRVRDWLDRVGVKTRSIEPGRPGRTGALRASTARSGAGSWPGRYSTPVRPRC
jgi:putative transposase